VRWLLEGGRVVDPSRGFDGPADVLIENDRIVAVAPAIDFDGPRESALGKVVCPGFVDMHVHLREPGRDDKETIESGVRAAVRGGFVAVGAMPNTSPPLDSVGAVVHYRQRGREIGLAHVHPIPCITKSQEGREITEFATLLEAGAVAFSDDGKCVMNAQVMRRALEYAKAVGALLIGHEEDEHLTDGGAANDGFPSAIHGIAGIPALSEEVIVARDLILAEETGARLHIAHISTRRAIALVAEAKRRGVRVTAEATPHHLLLDDEAVAGFDPHLHKMNPPLRDPAAREALVEALRDGVIDCVATDHAPHTGGDKAGGFGCAAFGVIGMESAVPVLLDRLVRTGQVPLTRMVEALSTRPARILGLQAGRSVSPGHPACLTVLDLEAPETLEITESKSRNCPFIGWSVCGLPSMTIVDGQVVMRDRRVVRKERVTAW
jgi:dihydroorotase